MTPRGSYWPDNRFFAVRQVKWLYWKLLVFLKNYIFHINVMSHSFIKGLISILNYVSTQENCLFKRNWRDGFRKEANNFIFIFCLGKTSKIEEGGGS